MAIFFILLPGWSVSAEEIVQVKLLSAAKVDSESILLGQIAEIHSADPAVADLLGEVGICRAPLPGQSVHVHPGRVETALKQMKELDGRYRLLAAGPVKVTRNYGTVSAEQIRDAVIAHIEAHAPWRKDQMKIRPIHYDQPHIVPSGSVTLQITAARHTDWLGAEPFTVRILVNGESVRRTAVPAHIEVWQEVFVAAKPLGRNQPITPADIKAEKMDLARLPSDAVVRADQALGKRANRSIAVNAILRVDQMEQEPVVRKGDRVQVLAESSLLEISTKAEAQESGCAGERIHLINLRSRKSIYARIIDAETVKVEF